MSQITVYVPEDTLFRLKRQGKDGWKPFGFATSPDDFNCMSLKVPVSSIVTDEENRERYCDPGYFEDVQAVVQEAGKADEKKFTLRQSQRIFLAKAEAANLGDPEKWWWPIPIRERRSSRYCIELHVPEEACTDRTVPRKKDEFQPALCEPQELELICGNAGIPVAKVATTRPCIYGPYRKGDRVLQFREYQPNWEETYMIADRVLSTVVSKRRLDRLRHYAELHVKRDGPFKLETVRYTNRNTWTWYDWVDMWLNAKQSGLVLVERPKRKRRVGGKKSVIVEV